MNFSSKQFISLLRLPLLLIIMGFSFLWGQQKFTNSLDITIPTNLTKITVKAWGAGGGGGNGSTGGAGGYSEVTVPVTPGDVYRVVLDKQVDTEILENLAQHLIFTQKVILFGLVQ